jgi:hypothetical protein
MWMAGYWAETRFALLPGPDEKMQKACGGAVPGCVEHKNVWGFVDLPLESP